MCQVQGINRGCRGTCVGVSREHGLRTSERARDVRTGESRDSHGVSISDDNI